MLGVFDKIHPQSELKVRGSKNPQPKGREIP